MAEQFLEPIYQEAKLLCELKQVVEWTRIRDNHHVMLGCNALLPELCSLCQRYVDIDNARAQRLWRAIQGFTKEKEDLVLMGDIIEHEILPLLEQKMRQWGDIETENEEGDYRFESTVSGFLTVKDIQENVYFHSKVDPMWEARKLAEYIFEPRYKSYSILGCGLGYLAYQLYLVSNGSVMINLFERDSRMVEYARNYGVLDWIPEDRLNIVIDEDIVPFLSYAQENNTGFYMFQPELKRQPEDLRPVIEKLCVEYNTAKRFEKDIDINFWRNIESNSKLVSEFDTTQLSKDYIVIAAGPSLDDNMEFLRENQGKKTLVAVGTVFRKLIENDITPDMVVILDPQERTYKQIEGLENQKVPMLILLSAYWKFAAAYQGDKYLVSSGHTKEMIEYATEHKAELWSCGGTVTSLALEVAIRFGAEKIYLVGVDLAYPGGVSHATGTMDRSTRSLEGLIPVEGVGGETVYSNRVFITYREGIEEKIKQTPQITYYNMSSVGAKIAGAIEWESAGV